MSRHKRCQDRRRWTHQPAESNNCGDLSPESRHLELKILTMIRNDIVAVIDDDPGVRMATASILSAFGYLTSTFKSAEEFLSIAAMSKAKCLVVDVQLGDISGVELARQLAEFDFKFPIIFMTALDDGAIMRQAEQLGCVAYLRKPFSADVLIEAVGRAIGHPS
jgi:FixJ family two-component response regulator